MPAIHSNIQTTVSKKGLEKIFCVRVYFPAPNSIYENCYKLRAAIILKSTLIHWHLRLRNSGNLKVEPYQEIPVDAEKKWGEELIDKLEKAVCKALNVRRASWLFLSGGIDSSAVVAMASRHVKAENLKRFHRLDEHSFDETSYPHLSPKIQQRPSYRNIVNRNRP